LFVLSKSAKAATCLPDDTGAAPLRASL